MSETTIFPVRIGGKIHAAFLIDELTDRWGTQCGRNVADPNKVIHAVQEVECQECADNIHRASLARQTSRRLTDGQNRQIRYPKE